MTKQRTIIFIISCIVLAIILVLGVLGIEQYYRYEVCNFSARDGESHGYYIYPGMTMDSLLTEMEQDYDIASMTDWRLHARQMGFREPMMGYYKFPARLGDKHLIRRLQVGEETPVRLTFTHMVRTNEQLAARLASQLFIDSTAIITLLTDNDYMARYNLNRETARCLFLPDTYEVYWTMTAEQLFQRMHKEYKRYWNEERLHLADSLGLRPTDVSIIASIVESETNKQDEYPTIASLYINRIHKGIPLQACPTVIYATGDFHLRRVLNRHLALDSPYNTYKYRGLPPGPIRCARKSTMDAVLHAPKTGYLYMCANPDFSGTHIFSTRFNQHAAVAREYQHELNNRQIR